jgi:hypothetical protein
MTGAVYWTASWNLEVETEIQNFEQNLELLGVQSRQEKIRLTTYIEQHYKEQSNGKTNKYIYIYIEGLTSEMQLTS